MLPNNSLSSAEVAVIEDESMIRNLLTEFLRPHPVHAFASGELACEWFKTHPVNRVAFVLCDHDLPGITGFETICKLRSLAPNRHFILMSGSGTIDAEAVVEQDLCDAFLSKPFNVDDLHQTMEALAENGPDATTWRRRDASVVKSNRD